MYNDSEQRFTNSDLRIEYQELLEHYQQLEMEHHRTVRLYESAKEKYHRMTEVLNQWAKKYYQFKLTMAADNDEIPSFESYASNALYKKQEIERLESLVHELSMKNNELEEKLVNAEFKQQATNWMNKKLFGLKAAINKSSN